DAGAGGARAGRGRGPDAPEDQGRRAGDRGRPPGVDLAGADPGAGPRPQRPGRVLPRDRRAPRPGHTQDHRARRRGGAGILPAVRPQAPVAELDADPVPRTAPELHRPVRGDRGRAALPRALHDGECQRRRRRLRRRPDRRPDRHPPSVPAAQGDAGRRDAMITGQLKNDVDRLWTEFWQGGISNPLSVIEQITFLMFLRMFDVAETREEKKASRTGKPFKGHFGPEPEMQDYRWQNFTKLGG